MVTVFSTFMLLSGCPDVSGVWGESSLQANEHHRFEKDLFEDGIMYYMSDCMKNRNYYIFTITPDGYEREVAYY